MSGGIKRDRLDALFSDLVRERAGYQCENCGVIPEDTARVHCAHIISRKYKCNRWFPGNAVCLCATCHARFTDHPWEFSTFLDRTVGRGALELLNERMRSNIKYSKLDQAEMRKHYGAELKRMRALRIGGFTGRLEFQGWM